MKDLKKVKYLILDMDGCVYHPKFLKTLFGQVSSRMTDFISLKLGIDKNKAKKMLEEGTISGGMIPKIYTCIDAVENGVTGVVIVDGRKSHSILFELFSDKGSGTLVRK